jgi:hypothetical protein
MASLAMLGLARHASPIEELLPDQAIKLPEGSREERLLRCAVATFVARLAGQRSAAVAPGALARAPEASEPVIADSAMRLLARLAAEGPKDLMGEWFACALRSGRVLPPQWIPAVFDLLTAQRRGDYAALFGARLRWLAAQDAHWCIDGADRECQQGDWETGSVVERVALLKRIRATDAATCRVWLEGTWPTDAPDAREAFIQVLRIGLTSGDEAFLERALEDKRKSVRVAAVDLLACLAESAFMQRMLARLQTAFVLEPKATGLLAKFSSRKLHIELPTAPDKAALRDGVEPKPPAGAKMGERSFWLAQMLSVLPPREWTRRFNCSASELLDAVARSEHADAVLGALSTACARHPEGAWVDALCAAWRARARDQPADAVAAMATVLAATPANERDDHLQVQLRALRGQGLPELCLHLLTSAAYAWSSTTTSLACDLLLARSEESAGGIYHLGAGTMETWGSRMDIATAGPLVQRLLDRIESESPTRKVLERLAQLIDIRQDIHKELLT